MFEIWGTFIDGDGRNERILQYFTRPFFDEKEVPLVPPCFDLWKDAISDMPQIVVTFRYFQYQKSPYVTMRQIQDVLQDFASVKEKTLIELCPMAYDYNLETGLFVPMHLNLATLRASVKCAAIFEAESMGSFYYTYQADHPHMVWLENTKSIAQKHNAIKNAGYAGIYWRYPYALLEGNWESMYQIFQKR